MLGIVIGIIIGALINSSGEPARKASYKKEFQRQIEHQKRLAESEDLIKSVESSLQSQSLSANIKEMEEEITFFSEGGMTQSEIADFAERKIDSKYYRPKKDCDATHEFYGKKVVITGKFSHFPDRNELAKILYDVGVDLDTSITQKIDFVVVGEDAGWRKLELIESYAIKVYSEDDIKEIFKL